MTSPATPSDAVRKSADAARRAQEAVRQASRELADSTPPATPGNE